MVCPRHRKYVKENNHSSLRLADKCTRIFELDITCSSKLSFTRAKCRLSFFVDCNFSATKDTKSLTFIPAIVASRAWVTEAYICRTRYAVECSKRARSRSVIEGTIMSNCTICWYRTTTNANLSSRTHLTSSF